MLPRSLERFEDGMAALREDMAACQFVTQKADELERPFEIIITVYPGCRLPRLFIADCPMRRQTPINRMCRAHRTCSRPSHV